MPPRRDPKERTPWIKGHLLYPHNLSMGKSKVLGSCCISECPVPWPGHRSQGPLFCTGWAFPSPLPGAATQSPACSCTPCYLHWIDSPTLSIAIDRELQSRTGQILFPSCGDWLFSAVLFWALGTGRRKNVVEYEGISIQVGATRCNYSKSV